MILTSGYKVLKLKFKQFVHDRYIKVQKLFFKQWNRINEEDRKKYLSFLSSTINYFLTSLLLSIPLTFLINVQLWKSVISVWFLLPFIEHYYVWFRETWKDHLEK